MRKAKFYWHIHHDLLVEPLTEPVKKRIKFIKKHKPKHERKTRLRLMKPVRGDLPRAVINAGEAFAESWNGRFISTSLFHTYKRILVEHHEEIEALHNKECPNCPWDGQTIFPGWEVWY